MFLHKTLLPDFISSTLTTNFLVVNRFQTNIHFVVLTSGAHREGIKKSQPLRNNLNDQITTIRDISRLQLMRRDTIFVPQPLSK